MNQNSSSLLRRVIAVFQRLMESQPAAAYDRVILTCIPYFEAVPGVVWRRCARITLATRRAPIVRGVPSPVNDRN